MTVKAAVIVDSRNVFHQTGDAIGTRVRPTVSGVVAAFRRYDVDVQAVHVGLAVARLADRQVLASYHATNEAYRQQVLSDGGFVLSGELHRKSDGSVQEKMVDGACNVRIARYVDEIAWGRSPIESIIVLSQDIDLKPATDYAVEVGVPVWVAALDVVHHRSHPYLLLGPHSYSEIAGLTVGASGFELRDLLVVALMDGKPLSWTVTGNARAPVLIHQCGLAAVPARGVAMPGIGAQVNLHPVDIEWRPNILGSFPLLVCSDKAPTTPTWRTATVVRRAGPLTLEISDGNTASRAGFPLGGVIPGDTVLVHTASQKILGRVQGPPHSFDPNLPRAIRVRSNLPKGGALGIDPVSGKSGLLITQQQLATGQSVPAVQVGLTAKGPVWTAVGTPLL